MNLKKFEFKNRPLSWYIVSVPYMIVFFIFLSTIIFLSVGFYLRIVFSLLLVKIVHHIFTKGMKSVRFLDSTVEVLHYNGKVTSIELSNIEAIESRKFTFYQLYNTNVVRYKKGSKIKQIIHFYCPDETLDDFKAYLSGRKIRYKNIGYE